MPAKQKPIREDLPGELQKNAVELTRLVQVLPHDLAATVVAEYLLSSAVAAIRSGRRAAAGERDALPDVADRLLEQYDWLELLATVPIHQPELVRPHRERITALLVTHFDRTP